MLNLLSILVNISGLASGVLNTSQQVAGLSARQSFRQSPSQLLELIWPLRNLTPPAKFMAIAAGCMSASFWPWWL